MSSERELISLCRSRIEQFLNWGDSGQWTNSDFELLSDKIFEKTQVRLSISTLKRIWGKVKYDNSPTAATLNALASFLDYGSWRDFEAEHNKTFVKTENPTVGESTPASVVSPRSRKVLVRALTMVGLLSVSAIILFLWVKGRSPQRFNPALATFKAHEVTDDLPNSVIFDYDVSAYKADSVFIQQNWDRRRREKVSLKGKQHTSVYYAPGYFEAKLIVNDSIIKEDIVYIQTKGWKGIIHTPPIPMYLSAADININGNMGFTSKIIAEKLGTSVFNQTELTLHNVRDFNVDVSSFDFEATLQNTSTPEESICRRLIVTILTTDGPYVVPLSTKGCISELGVMTDVGWKSGKDNDLSAFGCDFKTLEKLQVSMHDSLFSVSLNDKGIFTEKQPTPDGKIIGIRITFEGAGEVGYVKLNNKLIE